MEEFKYFVYTHTRLDKNEIFYVGKGTKKTHSERFTVVYRRAFDFTGRNKLWNIIFNKTELTVKIEKEFETEKEAIEYETELILKYKLKKEGGTLVNFKKDDKPHDEYIKEKKIKLKKVFKYDLNGVFIKEYASLTLASSENKCLISDLSVNISSPNKFICAGFLWSAVYKENLPPFDKQKMYKKRELSNPLYNSIPIYQFSLKGEFIKKWNSANQIERREGICSATIRNSMYGKGKSAGGYLFSYNDSIEIPEFKNHSPVNVYDINNVFIQQFRSTKEALEFIGEKRKCIAHFESKIKLKSGFYLERLVPKNSRK